MEMERTSALSFGRLGRFGGRAIIAWFEGQQTRPEAWADPPFDHDRQTDTRRYNQPGEQRGKEKAANDGYPHRRTPCRIASQRNRRGPNEIGRASGRERGDQYVWTSVAAVSISIKQIDSSRPTASTRLSILR